MRSEPSSIDILVVDDETAIADVVSLYLQREGWQVRVARDGRQALDAIQFRLPTLVILDLNLPQLPGLEILRQLRSSAMPYVLVIILTDQSQEPDRIRGLEMGADDYVTKPFSTAELVSRAKAVLRRTQQNQPQRARAQVLQFGDLRIDPTAHVVQIKEQSIELTSTEFDLLLFLARHPRQVFTKEQLMEKVWRYDQPIDANTVYVHMRRLRQKVERDTKNPLWLHTVWGTGYKFEPAE